MEASHLLSAKILDALPEPELGEIQRRQNQISVSIQKATASLSALNEFSAVKWADLHPKFESHTKLVKELQADLDHVFRKIRFIKGKLGIPNLEGDGEDEDEGEENLNVEEENDDTAPLQDD